MQVHHKDPTALGIFAREVAPAATAMAPGTNLPLPPQKLETKKRIVSQESLAEVQEGQGHR